MSINILHIGWSKKPVFHILLITVLCLMAYSNTFRSPFQFDDKLFIVENPAVKNLDLLLSPSNKGTDKSLSQKLNLQGRFIGYLTFALNYRIHKLDVTGYHVVNIFIHIVNALLVYWLLILTFRTPFLKFSVHKKEANYLALFVGLIFACHPVQTQAVTYIWQRVTSLATAFYFLSLVMYIKWRLSSVKNGFPFFQISAWLYVGSVVSAVLAMKTKEIAFTLPVVITLYEFMFFDGKLRNRLLFLFPLLLTMLIIPIGLVGIDKPIGEMIGDVGKTTRVHTGMSRWEYLFTQFAVIVTYIRLLFFPINQNLDYDYPLYHTFFTPKVFLSFFLLLSIFGFGVYMFFRSRTRSRSSRIFAFGIFWFFLTLSVESSIIPIVDVIYEHRLYLPSAGIFWAISITVFLALKHFKGKKPYLVALPFLVIIIALITTATYKRNIVWKDEISLWSDVVNKSPGKARPHYNLGKYYSIKNMPSRAIEQYQLALKVNPGNLEAHDNIGNAYISKGLLNQAIYHFKIALAINPKDIRVRNNLGIAYKKKGLFDNSIEQYQIALRLNPKYVEARYNLGNAYWAKGLKEKALAEYKIALHLSPNNPVIRKTIMKVYMLKGTSAPDK